MFKFQSKKQKKKLQKVIVESTSSSHEGASEELPSYSINEPPSAKEEVNLYKSCIEEATCDQVCQVAKAKAIERVTGIIEESVEMMVEELTLVPPGQSTSLIDRAEPPFTPITFTLWRKVALRRIRKTIIEPNQNSVRIEEVMDAFSSRVDN